MYGPPRDTQVPYGIELRECSIEARRNKKGNIIRGSRLCDDGLDVIVQRVRFVVLRQGFQCGVGKIPIGHHDTASKCDQNHEKNEAARSHGLLLFRHNLVLDLLVGGFPVSASSPTPPAPFPKQDHASRVPDKQFVRPKHILLIWRGLGGQLRKGGWRARGNVRRAAKTSEGHYDTMTQIPNSRPAVA